MISVGRMRNGCCDQERDRRSGRRRSFPVVLLVFLPLLLVLSAPAAFAAWTPEAEITAFLKEHYPWAEVDVRELELSASLPAQRPSALVVEKAPPGRSVFRFDFRNGRSITAAALVRVFDRVYMSRTAFRKDYVLRADDVYETLMESSRIPKGALREADRVVGKRLVRSVVQNAPITDAMVSDAELVKRGRKVMLTAESEHFAIKAAGETRSDAAVGDPVKVMNLVSHKVVTGLLVDENTVRVEY